MQSLRTGLATLAFLSGVVGPAGAETIMPINDRPFMNFMGGLEGPDGYNEVVGGATSQPPRPLVEMTIAEVLEYQAKLQDEGAPSTAMGKYQVIRKTLNEFVDRGELKADALFNRVNQDRLARILMNRCGFYNPDREETKIGNCLARVWAALPVLSGENQGRSHYHNVGKNRALTTPDAVIEILSARLEEPVAVFTTTALVSMPAISNRQEVRFADPMPLSP